MYINHCSKLSNRISIRKFLEQNAGIEKSEGVKQPIKIGYKKSTIYNTYKSHENNLDLIFCRKYGSKAILKKKKVVGLLLHHIKKRHIKVTVD